MFKNSSLESSLEYLSGMYTPSELILVGTKVESWMKIAKELDMTSVHYVDADEKQITKLRSLQTLPENWSLYHALLHKESTQISFYKLSNPALNGSISGEVLSQLWKNLKTKETTEYSAVSLHKLLENSIDKDVVKWLVIDYFNSLDILKGTGSLLNNIEVVMARVVLDDHSELADIGKEKLDSWMSKEGYKNIALFEENHPKVGISLYVKDYKSLKQESQKALETEKQTKAKELEIFNKTLTEEKKKSETLKMQTDALLKTIQERTKENEAFISQLDSTKQEFKKAIDAEREIKIKEMESFSKILGEEKNRNILINNKLDNLNKSIFNTMHENSLNTINQIESFINLQNYLSNGTQPLSFHGWPISPDIALFLIQKIEENNYDLIIEFGSGTSTAMIAKVIKKKKKKQQKLKLVTFEHLDKYYTQTLKALKTQKLNRYVDLILAPLVEYKYKDEEFRYYDCDEIFNNLKSKKKKKILVLIDGPPATTCRLARFPALPYLLEQFSGKEIHLVLDDYNRDEEKEVAEKWEGLLNEKSISFKSESIPSEKGLYFCQIN